MSSKEFETFEDYKNSLDKEPTDPYAKKEYIVGCFTPDDWTHIHQVLLENGTLEDNIPPQTVDCVDDYNHSPVRGRYLLNDTEAEKLRNHEKVEYVNINKSKYPGTYAIDPVLLTDEVSKQDRYSSTVKHFKDHSSNGNAFNSTAATHKNRTSYQQLRLQQKEKFWTDDSDVFDNKGEQFGTGKDVDVIVCDTDAWFGHIEFQNNLGGPQNYTGGNPLPGNGTCDLLDLILDAPYYLDPDFFSANASRTETRWDGTTVPTQTAARQWWSNNSTTYRSAKFVSPGNGGSATGVNDFGIISITTSYTRARCNGSNTAYHTGSGSHGTPCASQTYGRQYGWAYNANKFYINLIGSFNIEVETGFDIIKVFHQIKPINSTYGNQNPTITSNSFGYRTISVNSSGFGGAGGFYWYRPATIDGTTSGTSYSSKPEFLDNFSQNPIRGELRPSSMLTAGVEMIDAGVIMCCSAGNTNQKLVGATHPDYNNYINNTNNVALTSTIVSNVYGNDWYKTVNRQGFPAQVGQQGTGDDRIYRTICVGALDSAHKPNNTGQERKIYYSNKGELIDCYAPAKDTLASCDDNATGKYNRNDGYYTISGQQSVKSSDRVFGGTSSATPITCGMIATKLQYNRTWTWQDVKNWLSNQVGTQDTSEFYHGTEETSATSSGWSDEDAVHDSDVTVIWDAATEEPSPQNQLAISGNLVIGGVTISQT